MSTRQCRKCKKFKSEDDFWKRSRGKNGLHPRCKDCLNSARKITGYQWNGKREAQQAYHFSLKGKITHWKFSAKLRGIEWKLSEQDLQHLPLTCVYTGQELVYESRLPNTISLDRIDSTKGYEPGNIVFCCEKVNKMKQDLPVDQFLQLCRLITNRTEIILSQLE